MSWKPRGRQKRSNHPKKPETRGSKMTTQRRIVPNEKTALDQDVTKIEGKSNISPAVPSFVHTAGYNLDARTNDVPAR